MPNSSTLSLDQIHGVLDTLRADESQAKRVLVLARIVIEIIQTASCAVNTTKYELALTHSRLDQARR